MKLVRTAARTLLAGMFLVGGARAVAQPDSFTAAAKPVTDRVKPWLDRAVPWLPSDTRFLVRLNGAVHVTGGALLTVGKCRRSAALVLAGSLLPTTLAAHRYWEYDDPADRQNQQVHLIKNLGLLGGLLLAALDSEGRPGLAWRTQHTASHARTAAQTARRQARLATRAASMGHRVGRIQNRSPLGMSSMRHNRR